MQLITRKMLLVWLEEGAHISGAMLHYLCFTILFGKNLAGSVQSNLRPLVWEFGWLLALKYSSLGVIARLTMAYNSHISPLKSVGLLMSLLFCQGLYQLY